MSLVPYGAPSFWDLLKATSVASTIIQTCWSVVRYFYPSNPTPTPCNSKPEHYSSSNYSSSSYYPSKKYSSFSSSLYSSSYSTTIKSPIPKGLYKTNFNAGIVGQVKVGKSNFINAFANPKTPASVKSTEVIIEPTPYPNNENEDFYFFDCPGAGTPSTPVSKYPSLTGLEHYDLLVIMCGETFGEIEMALINKAEQYKIPFLLVRSMVDDRVRNIMENPDLPQRLSLEQAKQLYLREYQANVNSNLEKNKKPPVRVFFISSRVYSIPKSDWLPHYFECDEYLLFHTITQYYKLKTPKITELVAK